MEAHDNLEDQEQDDFRLKPVVYAIPGMEEVIVQKDIVYKTVDGDELKLDVYYPADYDGETRLPAVIFVHGDGPPEFLKDAKEWAAYISWGQLAAATGLIGVTFNHRSTEMLTKLYEAASDVDALIEFVRDDSKMLGIDANRLGIWVCSAGGPMGLRSALRDNLEHVRCIVSYYAISDLKVYYEEPEEETEFPGPPLPVFSQEVLDEFSGAALVNRSTANVAPMLIVRAGLDDATLNASIARLVTVAVAKNVNIDFMNHATGHHAFDMLDDDERSREIIRATLEFLRGNLL
ncbi:MAG TPA: alpha/beta hydrolase [Ktedonobacteraceae bacterium]|nr:alpha/beta hydrolase [Ktedonobacteraceae bacterium]